MTDERWHGERMSTSAHLAAALEAFICEEVARQLAELPTPAPAPAPDGPRAFTTATAAAYTGHHPDTIAKACGTGELVATQRVMGGRWSIGREALDAWVLAPRR